MLRATDEASMAELPEVESQGKAWWVQLQHQRAVDAGCRFCTHRPATSGFITSKQQQTTFRDHKQREHGRPSTVGSFERSARESTGALATLAHQHPFCIMRPCTSPKLPARRALLRRQASRPQLSSTAVSHTLPASRGNDWSPVHSRPTTTGTVSNMCQVKHPGAAHLKPTRATGRMLADVSDTASMQQVGKYAQPTILKHNQQRSKTTSFSLSRPSLAVCLSSPLLLVYVDLARPRQC